jgi:F-type H+-transporting ATPase subunit b
MEQLFSAFGVNWHLLIAQAVNFAIVLVALWYFLYKPVLGMLEKRKEIVAKGVIDAALAEEKLASADGEAAKRVNAAEASAEEIVAVARESANAEKVRLLKEAEERSAAIAKDAEARANEVAARARRESEQEVARLAILAAEKILRSKV